MTLEEFTALKEKMASLKSQRDEAAGALQQLLKELKNEFGVGSIKEAEKLLARLEKEGEKESREYQRKVDAFQKKWGNILDNGGLP